MPEDRDARHHRTATLPGGSISLLLGDITSFEGDAIVNAANSGLMGGGGVDGAIHRAAGPALLAQCEAIVRRGGPLPPGRAVITGAGRLPVKYVIHAVGPIWRDGRSGEPETLASAYRESVRLGEEHGVKTIAFPSISTGAYGYPVGEAAYVALIAVKDALRRVGEKAPTPGQSDMHVTFVLFNEQTFKAYEEALENLSSS